MNDQDREATRRLLLWLLIGGIVWLGLAVALLCLQQAHV